MRARAVARNASRAPLEALPMPGVWLDARSAKPERDTGQRLKAIARPARLARIATTTAARLLLTTSARNAARESRPPEMEPLLRRPAQRLVGPCRLQHPRRRRQRRQARLRLRLSQPLRRPRQRLGTLLPPLVQVHRRHHHLSSRGGKRLRQFSRHLPWSSSFSLRG